MFIETQQQLDELIEEWKVRLNLRDWEVTSELVREIEGNEHAIARNNVLADSAVCHIEIVEKYMIQNTKHPSGRDMERSLVHELLHCYTSEFGEIVEPDHLYYEKMLNEFMVNQLAKSFVQMKRDQV